MLTDQRAVTRTGTFRTVIQLVAPERLLALPNDEHWILTKSSTESWEQTFKKEYGLQDLLAKKTWSNVPFEYLRIQSAPHGHFRRIVR